MKIDIVHFTPVIGGETTLVKSMYKILREMGNVVRVIHPTKSGKMLKGWATFDGQNIIKIKDFQEFTKDSEILFFINSIHLKKFKKLEDRAKEFSSVQPVFSFENKKVIFYEHGKHSSDLYDYPTIFKKLTNQGNRLIVFTNTKEVISHYNRMGYEAFLIRQPFDPDYYPKLSKNETGKIQIAFNSRYTSNKRPNIVLPYFSKYLGENYNFELNFRGQIRDNVTIWYNLFEYFEDPKIIMRDYADEMWQIYNGIDYCLYAGYTTKSEKGKMEYSILEPFFYGIPLIVEKDVIETFKYEEYGISKEKFLKSVICLNEKNLDLIIEGKFDYKPFVENAKTIVEDFLPNKIKERLELGISALYKDSKIKNLSNSLF